MTIKAGEKSYGPFMYGGKYFETCNDVEVTSTTIYGAIAAFVVISIVAAVAVYFTFRYKRQYYELLGDKDETELKEVEKGPDTMETPDGKEEEVH